MTIMKKDNFIQFRINDSTKREFKRILRAQKQSMSGVLVYSINEAIKELNTHKCISHDFNNSIENGFNEDNNETEVGG